MKQKNKQKTNKKNKQNKKQIGTMKSGLKI